MAVDDPHFPPNPVPNCWGRNSQSHTLLRAFLWADRYGRGEWLDGALAIWLGATLRYADRFRFQQEIDPLTGAPVGDTPDFMPTLLLYLAACQRLFGV